MHRLRRARWGPELYHHGLSWRRLECNYKAIIAPDSRIPRTTMLEPINIRKIIEELRAGRMRVPNFQRGFVWDPERVAYLMDSIY